MTDPTPDEFVWLPASGGPMDGERVPYPGPAVGRTEPEARHRLELTDDGRVVAVYVWDPVARVFACRYDESQGCLETGEAA